RQPIGVVVGIVPWNFSIMIAIWKLAAALVCGCTIVIKPSEYTTLDPNTRRLVQLTISDEDDQRTNAMMDMLLAKKRSEDRRNWLQEKGDLADLDV
ncbi:aldehyde dehydrogenase family protein, partial [Salmonella enterica subsp. enterica serovar Kentucky]|nr:aldehyde dehydrogenase family protein [Salmonella enterica subsp. enterica serovar Kentucky]